MGKHPEILIPGYRALAPRHHDGRGPRVRLWGVQRPCPSLSTTLPAPELEIWGHSGHFRVRDVGSNPGSAP